MIDFPKKLKSQPRAFSLVEVVLALGIFSFVIVALLGLLAVSMNMSRTSSSDTVIASMATAILSELRRESFDDLTTSLQSGSSLLYGFSEDGSPSATNSVSTLYLCRVKQVSGAVTTTYRTNLIDCTLQFEWPKGAAQPQTKIIHARIARYD